MQQDVQGYFAAIAELGGGSEPLLAQRDALGWTAAHWAALVSFPPAFGLAMDGTDGNYVPAAVQARHLQRTRAAEAAKEAKEDALVLGDDDEEEIGDELDAALEATIGGVAGGEDVPPATTEDDLSSVDEDEEDDEFFDDKEWLGVAPELAVATDARGLTPLHVSAACGTETMLAYVKRYGTDLTKVFEGDKEAAARVKGRRNSEAVSSEDVEAAVARAEASMRSMSESAEKRAMELEREENPFAPSDVVAAAGVSAAILARLCQLAPGGDVNMRDGEDRTPLHYAMMVANYHLAIVLVRHGADPASVAVKDVAEAPSAIIELFLSGADPALEPTPELLNAVCDLGRTDVVAALLGAGAVADGETIARAAGGGNLAIVDTLLLLTDRKDSKAVSAAVLAAVENNHHDIMDRLVSHSQLRLDLGPALRKAVELGSVNMAAYLCMYEAKPIAADLETAHEHPKMLKLLHEFM